MQTSLYRISKGLERVKETPFRKERELQVLFEVTMN